MQGPFSGSHAGSHNPAPLLTTLCSQLKGYKVEALDGCRVQGLRVKLCGVSDRHSVDVLVAQISNVELI